MFSHLTSKMKQNDPTHQRKQQQIQQKMAQKQAEDMQLTIMNYLQIKELDNKLIKHCLTSCLSYNNNEVQDDEKSCLNKCNSQKNSFIKSQLKNFKEEEGGLYSSSEMVQSQGKVQIV